MRQIGRFVGNKKIKYVSSPSFFGYRVFWRGFFVYLKKMMKKLPMMEIWNRVSPSGRQYE